MSDESKARDDQGVDQLETVLADTEKILGGVTVDQSDAPTPCPEFDVSQLVDHILGWSANYASSAWGKKFDGDPNAHRALPEPTAEFRTYADTILEGYRQDEGSADRPPVGILLMDYQVHGWDLARATGQDVPFGDDAAREALEAGRQMLKPEYRGPDQQFGAEVSAPADASPVDQLVAFLGRDPGWTPPDA